MEICRQVRSRGTSSGVLLRPVTSVMAVLAFMPSFTEAADAPNATDQSESKLETIVVTAERRTTDLQTTAVAATVLTGENLTKLNINTIDSLTFKTPSLTLRTSGENTPVHLPA